MSCTGVEDPLEVTLQHLTSTRKQQQDVQQQQQEHLQMWRAKSYMAYQPPLSCTFARALHRVSQRHRCAVRSSRSWVDLERYEMHSRGKDIPAGDPRLVPWDYLAAAPALTAMGIQMQQVPTLLSGPQGTLSSLVGRLRTLKIGYYMTKEELSSNSSSSSNISWVSQVEESGRLLALCTGLQALSLQVGLPSEQERQVMEAALAAGINTSTPAMVSTSINHLQLSSSGSSGGGEPREAAAAAGGASAVPECSTARLPLLHLQLCSMPLSTLGKWLQQRGQLGQLQSLSLETWESLHFEQSWGWLTSLTGLQELQLEFRGDWRDPFPGPLPPQLTALSSSLTQLSVKNFELEGSQEEPLAALSALQRLQLLACEKEEDLTWEWLTALQQLTFLNLSGSGARELPEDLVKALPQLEVLLVVDTAHGDLPKGMTRLTRLDVSNTSDDPLSDASMAAVCQATALRQLNLSGRCIKYSSCLSTLSRLEVLQMWGSGNRQDLACDEDDGSSSTPSSDRSRPRCWIDSDSDFDESYSTSNSSSMWLPPPPPTLPRLVHLRHLVLRNSNWWVRDLAAMGGLQHLTFLDLSSGLETCEGQSEVGSLAELGALPALQQLNLSCVVVDSQQWPAVGAWLGQQAQLTKLSLWHTARRDSQPDAQQQADGLAQLPTQLVELNLSECGLQQLPPRLGQMTDLMVLQVGCNRGLLPPLPAWLTALVRLEVLSVHNVCEEDAQLLRQLPRLRPVNITDYEQYKAAGNWSKQLQLQVFNAYEGDNLFPEPPQNAHDIGL